MQDVEVISKPEAAGAALDPARNHLLADRDTHASGAELASRLGSSRQR